MLTEVSKEEYRRIFSNDPNPFISIPFIELNSSKVDKVVMLVNNTERASIGIIGGIKERIFKAPFSAPFGGFHFRSETINYSEIFDFAGDLKQYLKENSYDRIDLILPPDIYSQSFNAKVINALIRHDYHMLTPDITSIGDLIKFNGQFSDSKCRKFYRQAERNGLIFSMAENLTEKETVFNVITQNRAWLNRPIFMSLAEIVDVSRIWPVDFFVVTNGQGEPMASAILYRGHPEIAQIIWWGDNMIGRQLRAMDFLANKLWKHYKNLGYNFIDIGISTENGNTNTGLLRFKETLDAYSSLRHRFVWSVV